MTKKVHFLSLALFSLSFAALHDANSQEVASVSVDRPTVSVGEPVTIKVRISSTNDTFGCGVQVSTGDGRTHDARIFEAKDAIFEVPHTYGTPGNYTVSVVGKGFIRGLRSTLPCSGTQSVAVAVTSASGASSGSSAAACVEPSDEYRSVACPGGMVGQILEKRSYRCPGPVASGWTAQTTDCKASSAGVSAAPQAAREPSATPPLSDGGSKKAPAPLDVLFSTGGFWVSDDAIRRSNVSCSAALAASKLALSFHKFEPNQMTILLRPGGSHPFKDNPGVMRHLRSDIRVAIRIDNVRPSGGKVRFDRVDTLYNGAVSSGSYELDAENRVLRLLKSNTCQGCNEAQMTVHRANRSGSTTPYHWCLD